MSMPGLCERIATFSQCTDRSHLNTLVVPPALRPRPSTALSKETLHNPCEDPSNLGFDSTSIHRKKQFIAWNISCGDESPLARSCLLPSDRWPSEFHRLPRKSWKDAFQVWSAQRIRDLSMPERTSATSSMVEKGSLRRPVSELR